MPRDRDGGSTLAHLLAAQPHAPLKQAKEPKFLFALTFDFTKTLSSRISYWAGKE